MATTAGECTLTARGSPLFHRRLCALLDVEPMLPSPARLPGSATLACNVAAESGPSVVRARQTRVQATQSGAGVETFCARRSAVLLPPCLEALC
jgi:hypothetical protein